MNQLFVDEVSISKLLFRMIDIVVNRIGGEPLFSTISHLLVKGKFYHVIILMIDILELDLMLVNLREILFGLFCS